jgi:hypothetical protein
MAAAAAAALPSFSRGQGWAAVNFRVASAQTWPPQGRWPAPGS